MKTLLIIAIIVLACNCYMIIALLKISSQHRTFLAALSIIGETFENIHHKLDFNRLCLQYCLTSISPYLIAIKNKAIEREDYEGAEQYQQLLNAIEQLVEAECKNKK